jgi:hypothetical protein
MGTTNAILQVLFNTQDFSNFKDALNKLAAIRVYIIAESLRRCEPSLISADTQRRSYSRNALSGHLQGWFEAVRSRMFLLRHGKLAAVSQSVTLHACGPIQHHYTCFPGDRLKKKWLWCPRT